MVSQFEASPANSMDVNVIPDFRTDEPKNSKLEEIYSGWNRRILSGGGPFDFLFYSIKKAKTNSHILRPNIFKSQNQELHIH